VPWLLLAWLTDVAPDMDCPEPAHDGILLVLVGTRWKYVVVRPKHFLVRRECPWNCWHFDIRETNFERVLLLRIEQPDGF
jgi:hypothetical protein